MLNPWPLIHKSFGSHRGQLLPSLGLQTPKISSKTTAAWSRAVCPPLKVSLKVTESSNQQLLSKEFPLKAQGGTGCLAMKMPPAIWEWGGARSQGIIPVEQAEFTRPVQIQF